MRYIILALLLLATVAPPSTATAQGIELRVLSPVQGALLYGNTIIVRVETSGLTIKRQSSIPRKRTDPKENRVGQGHLLLTLDLQTAVVWDSTEPYALINVPAGEHVLSVELVQNDSSSFNPPVVEQVVFTTSGEQVVFPTTSVEVPAVVKPKRIWTIIGESPETAIYPNALIALCGLYGVTCGLLR